MIPVKVPKLIVVFVALSKENLESVLKKLVLELRLGDSSTRLQV